MASAEDTADERPPGSTKPAGQEPGSGPGAVAPEAPNPSERIGFIGKRLGRFRIVAELGRGGMATVYRARDPQLGRDVAVKVMHGFFAGRADIEARFRREANAVAAIRHPSILALYDFAPPAGEEPGYIVSELIEGHGLRHVVETAGGRLLPEVAVAITVRVAEALGAAHAAGIVHRDVKPDNVLIDRAGDGARVVLTDFGVAHVSGMDTMTATGAVLGSPAYMSPEQARGEDVGPPSDVFSLGVLLYQLCTGHLPFSGKDPLAVITAILRGDYLRPGKIEARVGPDLEQIIVRCLLQDSAARFPDGGTVARALRDLLGAASLNDESAILRRYLANPDGFAREVSPEIARAALAAAEAAHKRRQIPRAIAEVGRALGYAPDNPAAQEMLRRLGTAGRSPRKTIGLALAGAAVVVVVAFSLAGRWRQMTPPNNVRQAPAPSIPGAPSVSTGVTPSSASPSLGPSAAAGAPSSDSFSRPPSSGVASPLPKIQTPSQRLQALAPGTPVTQTRRVSRTGLKKNGGGSQTVGTPSPAVGEEATEVTLPPPPADPSRGTVTATATAPEKPTRDQTPGTSVAAEPASGSIVLRASQGFCEPSLDAHPPSLRASYNNLSAGKHEIYCTLPQGGGKVHVATYDLRPGTRPSLIVVRGADGRPTLGRPQ